MTGRPDEPDRPPAAAEEAPRVAQDDPPRRKRDRGRFSSKRKTQAVLAVLRGRDAGDVARIHRATLEEWRDRFVEAGRAELTGESVPVRDPRDVELERLRAALEDADLELAAWKRRCEAAESGRSFRLEEIEALGSRRSESGRSLGLQRTCEILGVPRSTVYFHKARREDPGPRKRGPKTLWSDEELLGHIRRILSSSLEARIGHRKVWERLRLKGVEASRGRVLRLMREEGLLAFERLGPGGRR